MRRPIVFALMLACHGALGCGEPPASSAAAGPAGARASAGAETRLRVVDGVNMDVRDVPLLMAFDELAAIGYDVERVYIAGNTLLADTLARGDAEVGVINNETAWSAIAKGADIRTVSEFTVYTGLVAVHNGIRSCDDLQGRPVAIPVTTGFAPLLFNLFMRSQCPGTEPQILVIAESSARTTALLSGRIDAAMVPGEELLKLQGQSPNRFHALAVPARQYPGIRVDGVQVRRAWAERHPDAVKALIAAQLRAHRLVRKNPRILYDESAKRLSLDPSTARAIADSHLQQDIWEVNGGLTRENIQSTIAFLVESHALPSALDVSEVADLSYLDAVLADLGRADPAQSSNGRPSPQTAR